MVLDGLRKSGSNFCPFFFLICLYVSTMLKCILLGKKKSLIVVLFYIFYRSSTYYLLLFNQ